MKPLHLAFILFIDLVWAGNIIAVKVAVDAAGPLTAVLLRYGIVALVCLPWLKWLPGRMLMLIGTGLVAGALFMGLGALGFAVADNISALAIAGQLGVPFSLILAVLVDKERIRWPRTVAIILSFAGVVVMGFDKAILHESLGLWLTVAACFCWAAGNLLFRRMQGVPVLTIHAWLSTISLPPLLLAALWLEPQGLAAIPALPWPVWVAAAYSALLSSLLGHGGMTWLFQRYPVGVVSPLTLPTPLLSVSMAVLVFHTPITVQMVLGGILTLVGVAIITLRTARPLDEGGK
ncbi:MAG: DMT family transporter [Sphingomonadales bacterium]|jgi:O-acetylserine/cysteine efflux transporter